MLRWRRGLHTGVRLRVVLDLEGRAGQDRGQDRDQDRDRGDLEHRVVRAVPIMADLAVRNLREPMGQRARMGSSGRWAGGGMTSL